MTVTPSPRYIPRVHTIILAMDPKRISLPDDVIAVDRPGFRGRRFTTVKHEERIQREKEERERKWALRCRRREELVQQAQSDIELQKAESIANLRQSLLRELAIRENLLQELSTAADSTNLAKLKQTTEKAKMEVVEALKTLS